MNTLKIYRNYTIEEIRQLEETCRKMRSEAIFNTFASLFTTVQSKISISTPVGMKRGTPTVQHSLGASAR